MTQMTTQSATRSRSKFVGLYYFFTICMGAFVLLAHGRLAFVADVVVTTFFLALTAFFYSLSKLIPGKHGRPE